MSPTGWRAAARFDVPEALRADVRLLGDALGTILREAPGTIGAAVDEVARLLTGLEFRPVLTAHPTEARRRAVVTGIVG
jgi:phosphoenolpyruvate carboxylase